MIKKNDRQGEPKSTPIFYRDHSPPHFYAIYGEYEITVEIESGIINGRFPKRLLGSY